MGLCIGILEVYSFSSMNFEEGAVVKYKSLVHVFLNYVQSYDRPDTLCAKFQGVYKPISSKEFYDRVYNLTYALWELGLQKGDRVGLLSENRPEWYYADLATMAAGGVIATIYPTLPPDDILYILKDSEAAGIFLSSMEQLAKFEKIAHEVKDFLRFVVVFDRLGGYQPQDFPDSLQLVDLEKALIIGKQRAQKEPDQFRLSVDALKPDDLATLVYTSGTTGEPKGVMLTQGNILSNVEDTLKVVPITASDTHISFLPLSHVFERTAGYYGMMAAGARICFAESIYTVAEDIKEIRPTIILAVPRFYEKIKAKIDETARELTGTKKKIFNWAFRVGHEFHEKIRNRKSPSPILALKYALAKKLVFKKIHMQLGGRIKLLISGAAPLSRDIAVFFDDIGLRIYEGYGLTETSPVVSVNRPDKWKLGTVGPPIPNVDVRIDEDGEILIKGPNVMKGYFKKPEATRAVFTEDGWFRTGDIGLLDEEGFLKITDRKKDIIVTAGGKNIAPQKVENRLKSHPWIEEAVVIGDKRPYPAALIVPQFELLEAFAQENGIEYESMEELLEKAQVIEKFQKILDEVQAPLARFEKVKTFVLLPQPFTISGGELTPTLKVRRKIVLNKFQHLIPRLYPTEEAPEPVLDDEE